MMHPVGIQMPQQSAVARADVVPSVPSVASRRRRTRTQALITREPLPAFSAAKDASAAGLSRPELLPRPEPPPPQPQAEPIVLYPPEPAPYQETPAADSQLSSPGEQGGSVASQIWGGYGTVAAFPVPDIDSLPTSVQLARPSGTALEPGRPDGFGGFQGMPRDHVSRQVQHLVTQMLPQPQSASFLRALSQIISNLTQGRQQGSASSMQAVTAQVAQDTQTQVTRTEPYQDSAYSDSVYSDIADIVDTDPPLTGAEQQSAAELLAFLAPSSSQQPAFSAWPREAAPQQASARTPRRATLAQLLTRARAISARLASQRVSPSAPLSRREAPESLQDEVSLDRVTAAWADTGLQGQGTAPAQQGPSRAELTRELCDILTGVLSRARRQMLTASRLAASVSDARPLDAAAADTEQQGAGGGDAAGYTQQGAGVGWVSVAQRTWELASQITYEFGDCMDARTSAYTLLVLSQSYSSCSWSPSDSPQASALLAQHTSRLLRTVVSDLSSAPPVTAPLALEAIAHLPGHVATVNAAEEAAVGYTPRNSSENSHTQPHAAAAASAQRHRRQWHRGGRVGRLMKTGQWGVHSDVSSTAAGVNVRGLAVRAAGRQLVERVYGCVGELRPSTLASALHACARVGMGARILPVGFLGKVCEALTPPLQAVTEPPSDTQLHTAQPLTCKDIAAVGWALAQMGQTPTKAWKQLYAQAVSAHVAFMSPHELVMIASTLKRWTVHQPTTPVRHRPVVTVRSTQLQTASVTAGAVAAVNGYVGTAGSGDGLGAAAARLSGTAAAAAASTPQLAADSVWPPRQLVDLLGAATIAGWAAMQPGQASALLVWLVQTGWQPSRRQLALLEACCVSQLRGPSAALWSPRHVSLLIGSWAQLATHRAQDKDTQPSQLLLTALVSHIAVRCASPCQSHGPDTAYQRVLAVCRVMGALTRILRPQHSTTDGLSAQPAHGARTAAGLSVAGTRTGVMSAVQGADTAAEGTVLLSPLSPLYQPVCAMLTSVVTPANLYILPGPKHVIQLLEACSLLLGPATCYVLPVGAMEACESVIAQGAVHVRPHAWQRISDTYRRLGCMPGRELRAAWFAQM